MHNNVNIPQQSYDHHHNSSAGRQDKPFIIPVFIPHSGCPHRCAFCNQKAIAGSATEGIAPQTVRRTIEQFLAYKSALRNPVQISFYGGNFLGLDPGDIRALLNEADHFIRQGLVDSIRFSTRPDTITPETLTLLRDYPVRTIEIGAQSMDDRVLEKSRRGHTAHDTEIAVGLLKDTPYDIGLQMMTGLPGDDRASTDMTADRLAALFPDFVRIYPAVVLKNSLLARWYASGAFSPLSTEEAVARVKSLYQFFTAKSIPVIRMGLQASDTLDAGNVIAGPYHPAFGHLVFSSIWLDKASELLEREKGPAREAIFHVRPENIPRLRGQHNHNISTLKHRFQLDAVEVQPDEKMGEEDLRLEWKIL